MAGVPITVLVKRRSEELDRLLARYAELTGKAIPELLNSTAVRFARAAFRATPPDEGRTTISGPKLRRKIVAFADGRFRVRYHTRRKKGVKYFSDRGEAEAFAEIMNRGAARYAWAGALTAFGQELPKVVPASFPYAGRGPTLAAMLSHGVAAGPSSTFAEVRNSGDYVAERSMNAGLRTANTGLAAGIKRLEEELAHGLN